MAHVLNKNKAPDLSTLAGRLAHCVEKAGGKRKLAASAILSEAQLFRYLHGLSDIPSERLITIAHAAEVDAGWLLTGHEAGSVIAATPAAQRPPFRPALMQYVARMLDEFLVEYQRSFSPRVKSQLLTLIYEVLRHDECANQNETFPNKFQMLSVMTCLESLKTEEQVALYYRALEILEYEKPVTLTHHHQLMSAFCSFVTEGYQHYYDAFTGTAYYDRVGTEALQSDVSTIQEWMESVFKKLGSSNLKLLDIGCGNGRYLKFFHSNYPKIQLAGIDQAKQAVELAQKLEQKGLLPEGTVQCAKSTELPYDDESFDLVFCRQTLHYQPYLPHTGLGAEAAVKEMNRILKPGGLGLILIPQGMGRNYAPFNERYLPGQFEELLTSHGFKLKSMSEIEFMPSATDSTVLSLIPTRPKVVVAMIEK